jgi:glycosyltransferase involved in cell wall biosynthesis
LVSEPRRHGLLRPGHLAAAGVDERPAPRDHHRTERPSDLTELRDSRLEVLGFVPDVRPLVSRAAIYICPIRVGGGTRLKILDALAMSRALVSTDLGVEGLDLTPEVHFLRANTPDEFDRQITRLEGDEALRLRLGRAGRELVEKRFSWDVVGQSLLESYERAAGRRTVATR